MVTLCSNCGKKLEETTSKYCICMNCSGRVTPKGSLNYKNNNIKYKENIKMTESENSTNKEKIKKGTFINIVKNNINESPEKIAEIASKELNIKISLSRVNNSIKYIKNKK